MIGVLKQWPNWPEFTKEKGETGDDLVEYKRAIVSKYGKDSLVRSWLRTCKEFESITENIAAVGSEAIPEVQFDELFTLASERKQELKDTGCFVVRQVVSQDQANKWFEDLKAYVAKNRASIKGRSSGSLSVSTLSLTNS
jgi:ABC-type Fe3+-hydroxamate transport system substrate-binding protein